MCIVTKSKRKMRAALQAAEKHSVLNKYEFNVNKSVIIARYDHDMCLYRSRLPAEPRFKYLGVWVGVDGTDALKQITKNKKKARKTWICIENYKFGDLLEVMTGTSGT